MCIDIGYIYIASIDLDIGCTTLTTLTLGALTFDYTSIDMGTLAALTFGGYIDVGCIRIDIESIDIGCIITFDYIN